MLKRAILALLTTMVLAGGSILLSGAQAAVTPRAHAAYTQQCSDPYSNTRDPANPLDLATAPGANPLTGAQFFVDGPAHGDAAGGILSLLGLRPTSYSPSESWATFAHSLNAGALHHRLARHPGLAHKVKELEKIGAEPEVQRVSAYSWGGTPDGIFKQTEKLLCQNHEADPGSIMILNTYFMHPAAKVADHGGSCPNASELAGQYGLFQSRINALAAAVDRRPAVFLLETDAIGTSSCIAHAGALGEWETFLRYEINTISALPHAVVYVEGGYSDSNSVGYTARVLNAVGVSKIRGFYTNDTHLQWTINEVRWATKIAKRTGGAHFIVNTAQNGRGPLLNKHPRSQGVEDLCNPPGRGLGPRDTTDTGFKYADAWMWTSPPGNSSGCGGGPSGGTFWTARAIGLAKRANSRLGPHYPSRPY
jgi:endoglucanase